ncbi:hypothetical protein CRUP_038123, partial [Coryphaenoides rupestris]
MFDGSLEILNATQNDEGVYTCLAENDRGKANSSGTLTITDGTSLTEVPEDTMVKVGEELILGCAASYDPMLDIAFVWAIDHRVIDFHAEWEHYERIMVPPRMRMRRRRRRRRRVVVVYCTVLCGDE